METIAKRVSDLGATVFHGGPVAHREGAGSGGVYFEDPDGVRVEAFTLRGMDGAPAPSGRVPTCGFF